MLMLMREHVAPICTHHTYIIIRYCINKWPTRCLHILCARSHVVSWLSDGWRGPTSAISGQCVMLRGLYTPNEKKKRSPRVDRGIGSPNIQRLRRSAYILMFVCVSCLVWRIIFTNKNMFHCEWGARIRYKDHEWRYMVKYLILDIALFVYNMVYMESVLYIYIYIHKPSGFGPVEEYNEDYWSVEYEYWLQNSKNQLLPIIF